MRRPWIKIEAATPDKPEICTLATSLRLDEDTVVGKLVRLWAWLEVNRVSGDDIGVTKEFLDKLVGKKGFAAALLACGWLRDSDGKLSFRNFDRHNGSGARIRALTAHRVAKHRVRKLKTTQHAASPPVSVPTQMPDEPAVVLEPEAMQPEVVQPEAMQPEAMQPEAMQPEAMQPEAMQPEAMQPEAMQPEVVQPEVVQPEAMQPEAMQPEAMQPEAVQPEAVQPEAVQPEAVQPEAVQPEPVEVAQVPAAEAPLADPQVKKRRSRQAEESDDQQLLF